MVFSPQATVEREIKEEGVSSEKAGKKYQKKEEKRKKEKENIFSF